MPDQAEVITAQLIGVVRTWSSAEGECKPSVVCSLVVDISFVNYHQCADLLSRLLSQGKLKLEPYGRGLYIPEG